MTCININDPQQRQYVAAVQTKAALKLAIAGVKASRHHTNKEWMTAAETITGRKFKARDYAGAVAALEQKIIELIATEKP